MAAHRRRRAVTGVTPWAGSVVDPGSVVLEVRAPADPVSDLVGVLSELRSAAGALQRLAPALPGVVGVRAERLAGDVQGGVRRWFPDA